MRPWVCISSCHAGMSMLFAQRSLGSKTITIVDIHEKQIAILYFSQVVIDHSMVNITLFFGNGHFEINPGCHIKWSIFVCIYIYISISIWRIIPMGCIWLVVIPTGWWLTYPSEKYEFVSWGYYSQYMEKCSKHVQTTNHSLIVDFWKNRLIGFPSIYGCSIIEKEVSELAMWRFPKMGGTPQSSMLSRIVP